MDEKTLRTTIHQMYQSAQSIAEKQEKQFFDTKDLQRVLEVAKSLYGEGNEVVKNMAMEDRLSTTDYTQKLAILKAQIDQSFAERVKR